MWWIAEAVGAPPSVVAMEDRVELDLGQVDDARAVPCGDAAVVVALRGLDLELVHLDAALQPGWTASWRAPEPVKLLGADADDRALWLLLHRGGRAAIHLLRVDLATGAIRADDVAVPVRRLGAIDDFLVAPTGAYFTAATGPTEAAVVFVPREGSPLVVPPPEITRGRRIFVDRLTAGDDSVDASIWTRRRGQRSLYAARLDGTRSVEVVALPAVDGDGKNWVDGQLVDLPDGRRWVVGTWADGDRSTLPQGLFVSPVEGGVAARITYTAFTSLPHFFDHLPEARRQAVQARIARKRAAGEPVQVGYNLLVHDALVVGDRVVVVAEAYVARYHTQTRTITTTVNGVVTTTTQTTQVFDGWAFTHAIAVAYAPNGDVAWDASVPMGDILTYDIRPHVRAAVEGDRVTLGYVANGRYSARTFVAGVEVEATRRARIATEDGERVVRGWAEHTETWGDRAFLVSGFQRVAEDAGRRRVFAVARVAPP